MKFRTSFSLSLLVLLVLSACNSYKTQDPGNDHSSIYATAVAQTMAVQGTQKAGSTGSVWATPTAALSPPASVQPEITQQIIATPSLPATPMAQIPVSTQTPAVAVCDAAEFVGDVTIPEGSLLAPGAEFKKIWRLKNTGTCTWTSDYDLVFVSGASMGTFAVERLPRVVKPDEVVDISKQLTAPMLPGSYQGKWMLRNASEALFGTGDGEGQALTAQIQVASGVSEIQSAFDLTANFCLADWSSGAGSLSCPGNQRDLNGFVTLLDQPVLESGKTYDFSILTHPDNDLNGWITGRFPYYQINDGDRFQAKIGCLNASQGCNVLFQLAYQTNEGSLINLGAWRESYDGQATDVNVNLSGLAGQDIQFLLTVKNNGRPGSANAFWRQARIQNIVQSTSPALIWNRDSGEGETCDELRIYLYDENSGSAQAFDCFGGHEELGWASLTSAEVEQIKDWVSSLMTFDAQVYHGYSSQSGTSWIDFRGNGDTNPRDSEIRAMDELAGELFAAIKDLGGNSP